MRKVFLDIGGHDGRSVKKFRERFDPECKWEIFTFEPHLDFVARFPYFENHEIYPVAVWVHGRNIEFFKSYNRENDGSTIIKTKKSGEIDYDNPILVPCIDFSVWLKNHVSHKDFVVAKFNIEGAEYQVIRHLIRHETIYLIKFMWVSWHWDKIGMDCKKHYKFVENIPIPITPMKEFRHGSKQKDDRTHGGGYIKAYQD
jgi:FkbM family methyltransferase